MIKPLAANLSDGFLRLWLFKTGAFKKKSKNIGWCLETFPRGMVANKTRKNPRDIRQLETNAQNGISKGWTTYRKYKGYP